MKGPPSNVQRWQVAGLCLALAAITFAVFGQTLRHEFINYDDGGDVYKNPVVARGLTLKGFVWAFSFHSSNWFPLTWLSHMLDCQLYGLNPGGHHLTNVLLHTATVILLFLVLRRMTGALWRSAFVAAVFAIHPLRVESVAWVTERKDMLSGLFFVLTIGAYVRYARRPGWHGGYGLILLLFALGLMCKPMLVTLPVVLLLLDYWPLQRKEPVGKLVLEKLPLLALSAASCVVTVLAQHEVIQSAGSLSLPCRLGNALASGMVYLGQMVWPSGLAVFYPLSPNGTPTWEMALAAILLAGFSAIAFWQRRKQPWLLMGWLWYLVMLLPVVGVIQVGGQAHADRYTYLPQIGIYVALTWLAAEWHASRAVFGSLMTGVVAVLMVCAWQQTAYWQDSETLWRHTAACTTDNTPAFLNLVDALLQKGKVDEAMTHLQKALQINPDNAEVRYNYGNALVQKGRLDEAILQFQQALQIKPAFALAHNNLGNALLQKGGVDEAIAHFQKALAIEPDDAEARNNLGLALLQKGQLDEATALFQKALAIKPDYADACYNLGVALGQKGRPDEAMAQYQKALQIQPDYAKAHNNLGLALLQKGQLDEAMAHFQKALAIKPDYAEACYNLGLACFQQGRGDEAISQYQKALAIKPDYAQACNNLGQAFLQKGNVSGAITYFQKALQIDPANPIMQNNLAWLLATCAEASLRNGNKAVALAERANQLTGGENPAILHTLAAAFAEAGRFADATRTAQKAIAQARAAGQQDMVARLNEELKRYEAGLPLHQ